MSLAVRIATEIEGLEAVTQKQLALIEELEKRIELTRNQFRHNIGRLTAYRETQKMLEEPAIQDEEARRFVDQLNEIKGRHAQVKPAIPRDDVLSIADIAKKFQEEKVAKPHTGPLDVRFEGDARTFPDGRNVPPTHPDRPARDFKTPDERYSDRQPMQASEVVERLREKGVEFNNIPKTMDDLVRGSELAVGDDVVGD